VLARGGTEAFETATQNRARQIRVLKLALGTSRATLQRLPATRPVMAGLASQVVARGGSAPRRVQPTGIRSRCKFMTARSRRLIRADAATLLPFAGSDCAAQ
jgi:hypothetical protein